MALTPDLSDGPDFLVVGGAKCASTSLAWHLGQHPSVFVSRPKEPRYFVQSRWAEMDPTQPAYDAIMRDVITDPEQYAQLFAVRSEPLRGEASTSYLLWPDLAIPNIKAALGDVPILIILRHPVFVAWSSWKHLRSDGREPGSFEQSLAKEDERIRRRWAPMFYHRMLARHASAVEAYLDNFDKVHVLFSESLHRDPTATLGDAFRFLGADPEAYRPEEPSRHNSSSVSRLDWADRLLASPVATRYTRTTARRLRSAVATRFPARIRPETFDELSTEFAEEIDRLEQLVGTDLSHWREATPASSL